MHRNIGSPCRDGAGMHGELGLTLASSASACTREGRAAALPTATLNTWLLLAVDRHTGHVPRKSSKSRFAQFGQKSWPHGKTCSQASGLNILSSSLHEAH